MNTLSEILYSSIANKAIIAASKNVSVNPTMESSARACLSDAINQFDNDNFDSALMWAKKSLSYSVGIFHSDYKKF